MSLVEYSISKLGPKTTSNIAAATVEDLCKIYDPSLSLDPFAISWNRSMHAWKMAVLFIVIRVHGKELIKGITPKTQAENFSDEQHHAISMAHDQLLKGGALLQARMELIPDVWAGIGDAHKDRAKATNLRAVA